MTRSFLLIGLAALAGMAVAAPEPPATHEPTLIGNASRSVSPAGYVYTDPPTPFAVPSGRPAKARHAHKAPPAGKTARR